MGCLTEPNVVNGLKESNRDNGQKKSNADKTKQSKIENFYEKQKDNKIYNNMYPSFDVVKNCNSLYEKEQNFVRKEEQIIDEKRAMEIEDAKNFYDLIINFDSFKKLKSEGWPISYNKEGRRKYENSIKKNNIAIGVIGNKNRGKSYLLGRIIGLKNYENPNGFLVTTHGISCNFPKIEDNDNIFITLDTAGKDNPLLQQVIPEKDKKKNEIIKDIARDQKITEIVLADFIIEKSDILITVLEQLSYSEQEMLRNLINQLKTSKREVNINNRKLIVIHNLMYIKTVEGIEKYIKDILYKSLTFTIATKKQMTNFLKDKINDTNKYIYIQKT